jgi:hypothetical protein
MHGVGLRFVCAFFLAGAALGQNLGNHPAVYDAHGALLPWTPWRDALQREVNWYLNCPLGGD